MNLDGLVNAQGIAYIGYLPAPVRYDPNLPDKAKLLYVEITARLNQRAVCTTTNKEFADLLEMSERTVSRYLNILDERYIIIENDGADRVIRLPYKQVTYIIPPKVRSAEMDASAETLSWMEEFLATWCKLVDTKIIHKKSYYPKILERLETFSQKELMDAIHRRADFVKSSEWHQLPKNRKHAANLDIVIRDDEAVVRCLSLATSEEVKQQHSVRKFEIDDDLNITV